MIIIHAMNTSILPRLVTQSITDRLRVMPAVVVTGARQTGKSTLVQDLAPGGRRDGRARVARQRTTRLEVASRARSTLPAHSGALVTILPATARREAR